MMQLKEKKNNLGYFFIACLIYLFSPNVVFAENIDNKSITIEDVYNSIDKNYPSLVITKQERLIADSKLLSAQGSFDPSFNAKSEFRPLGYYRNGWYDFYFEQPTTLWGLNFFSGWRMGLGTFAAYEGKPETNLLGEYRTGFELPLLKDGFTDRRRTNIFKSELKQLESDLKIIQKRIESRQQGAIKYWKWVGSARNYFVIKKIFDIAIERDNKIKESARLGNISPIESIENQRLIFQRQSSLISSEKTLEQSANELSIYLRDEKGLPYIPQVSQVPNYFESSTKNDIPLLRSIEIAYQNNPQLKILTNNIESQNAELIYLENQRLPEVDIFMAISQDIGSGSKTREPFVFDAGFKVKAPLWLRTAEGKINEQKLIINQTQLQLDFLKDQIKADVNNSYISLDTSYRQLELAKQELELSLKLEQAEKDKFDLGDSNMLFINIREQAVADARIREINAIIGYNQSLADYKAVLSNL